MAPQPTPGATTGTPRSVKRIHRGGPSGERRDAGRLAVDLDADLAVQADDRGIGVRDARPLGAEHLDRDASEAAGVEVAPKLGADVVGVLVGDEAEIDLGGGARRDDRLGALTLVAGSDPGDVRGGREVGTADIGHAAQEAVEAELIADVGRPRRHRREELLLARARRPDVVVKAWDQDSLIGRFEARQRPDQPPRRVRQQVRLAGMGVARENFHGELDIEEAAGTQSDDGRLVDLDPALLPDRGVGPKPAGVLLDPGREVGAADLLLALGQPGDVAGVGTGDGADRVERRETADELALVVLRTSRKDRAVPLGEIEGRTLPQVQRLRRLDVVVVVEEEGSGPVGPARMAEDHGVAAGGRDLDGEAALLQHPGDEGGALVDALVAGRDAGHRAELAELRDPLALVLGDVTVDRGEVSHALF